MDEIKTIREALEWVNARYDETEIIKRALAAMSRLAEPGEDAREAISVAISGIDAYMPKVEDGRLIGMVKNKHGVWFHMDEVEIAFSALIERYVAAQVAKARDEEREACAERAIAWQKKLCADDGWPCRTCTECDQLRAAINGKP